MTSLVLVVFGTLIALAGLVTVLPQVKARRIDPNSIGAWIFRAGVLALISGEAVAVIMRPEKIVLKVMLISGAAILFFGLTMLPHEWQQPGFVLERAFSWQVMLLGLAAFLSAVMFFEFFTALAGVLAGLLGARYARQLAAAGRIDIKSVFNAALGGQAGLMIVTVIFLFF
jgi:hypothetical protein